MPKNKNNQPKKSTKKQKKQNSSATNLADTENQGHNAKKESLGPNTNR